MIPKPPFVKDLTPEQEISEFQRLKPRLAEVWDALTMREEEPHTAVVVPSLTLDQSELRKISGASFYEERLLFLLIRLAQPARAHGVRDLAADPPDHPRVLPAVPGGHPGEPRALAAHALVRRRRLAALAHREDPRAAAPDRADPGRHHGPAAGLPHGLQLDPAREEARRAARDPAERLRPAARQPGHEVRQPQGVPRGGGAAARGLRGRPHAARDQRGARRAAGTAPGDKARGGQARRELLRRGQRALPLPRDGLARGARRVAAAGGVRGRVGDARGLLRQDGEDGRDRRGVHRGRGKALAERPAADRAARRRD